MEDIIEKLYEAHLKTESFPFGKPNKEDMMEEWELYNLLYESLLPEQKKSFLRYVDLRGVRQNQELKSSYECGFKTAVKLFVQSMKE
nr:hypothetical protein [Clostridia bacterium]